MRLLISLTCAGLAILAGCARFDPLRGAVGPYRDYTEIKGEIKDGRYTSPETNFSCQVPALEKPGAVIKDDFSRKEGTGVVAFGDGWGLRLMVHWFEVPSDVNHSSDSFLFEPLAAYMKEQDLKTLPKATFEAVKLGMADQPTLFFMAVGEAPGVKVYIPPEQRKTVTRDMVVPHVFRGHLVFRRGGWVYALTTQKEESGADKSKTTEQKEADLKSELQKCLATFEFK